MIAQISDESPMLKESAKTKDNTTAAKATKIAMAGNPDPLSSTSCRFREKKPDKLEKPNP